MTADGGRALPGRADACAPDAPRAAVGAHGEPGVLVVLEGIDRSGRSTHTRGLEERLRYLGRGVTRTSLGTAQLAGPAIRAARAERSVDARTMTMLYAADIAERIEQVILPALRAGLVVLADRYVYTPMARAAVRGIDEAWLGRLFSFAPAPDAVVLLRIDPATAAARARDRVDPFEAGADLRLSPDLHESFALFQGRLAAWFDAAAVRYGFETLAAERSVESVEAELETTVERLLDARLAGPVGASGSRP